MELLEGVEGRVVKGMRKEREKDGENDLGREEIERVLRGLKDGKAAGVDGAINEL